MKGRELRFPVVETTGWAARNSGGAARKTPQDSQRAKEESKEKPKR